MKISTPLLSMLLLAALPAPAALAQSPAPGPAAGPFRFELHWKSNGSIALAGKDGCAWNSFSFKCTAAPCVVVIGSAGVTTGDAAAKPGAALQLKLDPAAPPVMTCLVDECSWAIEHADGSVHSSGLRRDGTRRLDELGEMDVLIEP
jgi:hypothetical protein